MQDGIFHHWRSGMSGAEQTVRGKGTVRYRSARALFPVCWLSGRFPFRAVSERQTEEE